MIFNRHWLPWLVAAGTVARWASAQTQEPGSAPSPSESPAPLPLSAPTPVPTPSPMTTPLPTVEPTGSPASAPEPTAPTFTLPAFYGQAPTSYTGGVGRLGKQRLIYSTSVSWGYDDNVLQTPTDALGSPAVYDPLTGILLTEEVPPPKRIGSLITQGSLGIQGQFYSPRSLFTFNLKGNGTYYWDRPGSKQTDYTGALELGFLYRLTPRLQLTTQINAAYLTQPDLSRINTPEQPANSDYLNSVIKLDLAYRWTPRLSTVLSVGDNALYYQEKASQVGDYNQVVYGAEMRYLWSPSLTVLAEARRSAISYDQSANRDASDLSLLVGVEWRVNSRLATTLRVGQTTRTFEQSGDGSSAPHLEGTVTYRLAPATSLNLNARFGFEEPDSPTQEKLTWRVGGSLVQAFSARLSAQATFTYLNSTVTDPLSESTSGTFQAGLRVQYYLSKRFSIHADYSFTALRASTDNTDYYRNQFFIGAEYEF